jgi:hypothetical protein
MSDPLFQTKRPRGDTEIIRFVKRMMELQGYHAGHLSEMQDPDDPPTHFIKLVEDGVSIVPIQQIVDDFIGFIQENELQAVFGLEEKSGE